MNAKTLAALNGANARCLARITGKDSHAEVSERSRTYDLVGAVRRRRYRWLGHILRMPGDRLLKEAVKVQFRRGLRGNMFMDVDPGLSFKEIEKLAQDRDLWKSLSI